MKKLVPNQLFNQTNNKKLFVNSANVMIQKLLLILVFAFLSANTFAQQSRNAPEATLQLMPVDDYITSLSGANNPGSTATAQRIKSLINDLHSAVYFYDGVAKSYGDSPVGLFTDVRSIQGLASNRSAFSFTNIEIVTIRINQTDDLNKVIDLSVFGNFPKLLYINIQSDVDVKQSDIQKMLINSNPKYRVFYDILSEL